jgi:hypothetical protein
MATNQPQLARRSYLPGSVISMLLRKTMRQVSFDSYQR